MRRTTLASLLLVLALCGTALQQAPPCFQGTIPDVRLLKGDIHAVDVDSLLIDSKITYSATIEPEAAGEMLNSIKTFNWEPSDYTLNETLFGKVNTCTSYSQGLSDGDWAFLCDQNKIVFVSVNETTGFFDEQRTTVINLAVTKEDETLACDSIRNGGTQNLYAVCQKPGSDSIYIFTLDLATPVRQEPDIIEQPKTEYKLVAPFKLSVNEYLTDAGQQISIFIHEREPKTNQLHFRMFKFAKGKLIDGGYFSTLIQNSIKNGKDGQLQSVFVNDEFVFLNTRSDGNKNFLQKCLRNPVYSTFICEESYTTLLEGDYRIKFFYVDKTKRTTKMVWVYYVSATEIKIELFDPDTNTYIQNVDAVSFSGHSLKKVVDYQRAGNNFFLVGPTDSNNMAVADGLVKLKTKSSTWEEYSYGPQASLGLVMQDLHETHYANYLAVGFNQISFKRIKKNILVIKTDSLPEETSEVVVSITCEGDIKKSKGKLTFNIKTQKKVNEDSELRVSVPSVEAYVGSSFIYLPTNGDEIVGNAPVLKSVTTDPLKNITLESQMINTVDVNYDIPSLSDLTGLRHVGENYFAVDNQDSLQFFRCLRGTKNFKCTTAGNPVDLKTDKLIHINTEVAEGIALVLLSQKEPTDESERQNAVPKTVIQAIRLEDGQKEFEDKTYDFYTKTGRVRVLDQQATLIMAGAARFTANVDMHYIHVNMSAGNFPKNVGTLTSFQNHICPAQISWGPRGSNVLYVSSICDKNGLNNHVFKYDIDFEKPFRSQITEVYVVEGSRNFAICAQERLLNIVDMEQNWFYSFDTKSSINAKLYFPIQDYGITSIKNYACDQNNNILQLIGCTAPEKQTCHLLTYRANLAHIPNKRVHSVQKIDNNVEFIASSFNDQNDDTFTMLMGKSTITRSLFLVEVDGPHLRFKADTENSEGKFLIKETFAFLGENGVLNDDNLKVIPSEHNLTLVRQPIAVNMTLMDSKKKIKADNTLQNIEDYVTITGPYHSLVQDAGSKVQLIDRMTPTYQFDNLEPKFDDSMFYKEYIFGYMIDGLTSTLALFKGNTSMTTVPGLDSVSDLQFVAKSDNEFYFFALVRKTYKKDRIYTIYTKNGGQTWATAHTSLDTEGYKIMEVKNGPNEYFVFGGYNNLRGYKAVAFAFKVEDKSIIGTAPNPYMLSDNIVDFDVTFFEGTRYVIVVAGMEYSKQASFLWYEMDDSGYMDLVGDQKISLVPNVQETHQDIVFRCEQRNNSKDFLWCINSGKNLYSYFVKYQLDWTKPTTGLARNFITKSFVDTKFRNIVNLRPIKVDISEDFVAFMVKNELPVQTGGQTHPGAFFSDGYLCLVYKISSNIKPVDEGDIPIRDTFKVLTMQDLEVTDLRALQKLDPKLFKGTDNKWRLGVNVGAQTRSIKVFNLNGLTVIVDPKIKDFKIQFKTIVDGSTADFNSLDFFDYTGSDDPKPTPGPGPNPNPTPSEKKKGSLTWIIIVCVIVVLVVLGVVGFIVTQKPSQNAEDLGIDDVEKTMKQPDDSSAGGQYSKL